jgi:hypothetical protein
MFFIFFLETELDSVKKELSELKNNPKIVENNTVEKVVDQGKYCVTRDLKKKNKNWCNLYFFVVVEALKAKDDEIESLKEQLKGFCYYYCCC